MKHDRLWSNLISTPLQGKQNLSFLSYELLFQTNPQIKYTWSYDSYIYSLILFFISLST